MNVMIFFTPFQNFHSEPVLILLKKVSLVKKNGVEGDSLS